MDVKMCTKCEEVKEVTNFSIRRKDAKTVGTRYQAWCKECYSSNHRKLYSENPAKYSRWSRTRRKVLMQRLFDFLRDKKCIDCGNTDSRVLEFDHRDPTKKVNNVSNLLYASSWKKVLIEIEKCDIVCANCHRLRTIIQQEYYKDIQV